MERTNSKAMDNLKKNRSKVSKMDGRRVVGFVGDVKQELKRVEWTSKSELKSYTKIVLLSMLISAFFVYFIDLVIQGVLGGLNLLVKFFAG